MSACPCGSSREYAQCCEPYITGSEHAPTAESLMRSRYTAFTKADIAYIEKTHHPKTRQELDVKGTEQWAKEANWQGLEVISATAGKEGEKSGEVEFKAHYRLQGELCVLHEVSKFEYKDKQWFYVDGRIPDIVQYRRESPKVGRNEPCVCGSGKKYKKCCGAAA